jgi:hypothetical protein
VRLEAVALGRGEGAVQRLGPARDVQRGGGRIVPVMGASRAGRREAAERAGRGGAGRGPRHDHRPRRAGRERLRADLVGGGPADVAVDHDRELHGHVVDGGRLRGPVSGEAQQQRAFPCHVRERVGVRRGGDGGCGDVEGVHRIVLAPAVTRRRPRRP